jgi:hypothetical protein
MKMGGLKMFFAWQLQAIRNANNNILCDDSVKRNLRKMFSARQLQGNKERKQHPLRLAGEVRKTPSISFLNAVLLSFLYCDYTGQRALRSVYFH